MGRTGKVRTPQEADSFKWRGLLVGLGLVLIAIMIWLEFLAMDQGTTKTEDKATAHITTTTTKGTAIPATLVTACLGGAILLFVSAAFYPRITKITKDGIELAPVVDAAVKTKATAQAKAAGKPEKATELAELSRVIASHTNQVVSLSPDELADVSVSAAAKQLKLR